MNQIWSCLTPFTKNCTRFHQIQHAHMVQADDNQGTPNGTTKSSLCLTFISLTALEVCCAAALICNWKILQLPHETLFNLTQFANSEGESQCSPGATAKLTKCISAKDTGCPAKITWGAATPMGRLNVDRNLWLLLDDSRKLLTWNKVTQWFRPAPSTRSQPLYGLGSGKDNFPKLHTKLKSG